MTNYNYSVEVHQGTLTTYLQGKFSVLDGDCKYLTLLWLIGSICEHTGYKVVSLEED